MTLQEYRIRHSTLIEHYQWIEFDLEGLYAALSEDPFHEAIREIERDSIGGVVREIRQIEARQKLRVLSDAEYEELDQIRERRNFWSHQCYTEACRKDTGLPGNAGQLLADLQQAEATRQWVRQRKCRYIALDCE